MTRQRIILSSSQKTKICKRFLLYLIFVFEAWVCAQISSEKCVTTPTILCLYAYINTYHALTFCITLTCSRLTMMLMPSTVPPVFADMTEAGIWSLHKWSIPSTPLPMYKSASIANVWNLKPKPCTHGTWRECCHDSVKTKIISRMAVSAHTETHAHCREC